MKTIVLACGCFWGAQHFFSRVDGVNKTECGYANGNSSEAPSYEQVYTDKTGFAEAVRLEYDPRRISLEGLLELFFCIIDPLSLNRQGEDVGTRYRTGVYYLDEADRAVAESVFAAKAKELGVVWSGSAAARGAAVGSAASGSAAMAVELEHLRNFFPAEEYHQDYLEKTPGGYCHIPLRTFTYLRLWQDMRLMLEGETDMIAKMANCCALIQERMGFFWTGFYIVRDRELVLGPFQGPSACFRIAYGRGVCGSAWEQGRTLVVPDVEQFPGHIACSSLSRSEIVVPVRRGGEIFAVLDIDSTRLAEFDATDALWLGKIAALAAN